MTTLRRSTGSRLAGPTERPAVEKYSARRFPVQHEIQKLEDELSAFNERIAELEGELHRSHAMDVLKAKAMDFARQIDELRCVLLESGPNVEPRKRNLSKS